MPATRSNPLGSADPAPRSAPSPRSPPAPSSPSRSPGAASSGPRPVSTVGKVDFETPLAIPPLAESTVDADGTRVFALDAQAGTTEFAPGVAERHLGLQRLLPRPDPRRRSAASTCGSTSTNSLDEPTTVHWHGMHLPAEMDGGPHQMVEPDATWSPEWDIDQQAATLWYHPHPHGETETHVARGLAGHVPRAGRRRGGAPAAARVRRRRRARHRAGHRLLGRRRARGRRSAASRAGSATSCSSTARAAPTSTCTTSSCASASSTPRRRAATRSRGATAAPSSSSRPTAACSRHPSSSTGCCCRPANAPRCSCGSTPGERLVLRSEMTAESAGMIDSIAAMNGGTDAFDVLELRAADTLDPAPDVPDAARDAAARRRGAGRHDPQLHARRLRDQRLRRWTWAASTRPSRSTRPSAGSSPTRARCRTASTCTTCSSASPRSTAHRRPPSSSGWKDTIFAAPRDRVRAGPALRGLRRPRHPVHVPLPPAVARGPGHDGPVRRRRTGSVCHDDWRNRP